MEIDKERYLSMKKDRVLIMGAAGRDFHNFNVYFRGNEAYEVVAFTATQIPNIEGRIYPSELAGPGYPDGIPIYPESKLTELILWPRPLTCGGWWKLATPPSGCATSCRRSASRPLRMCLAQSLDSV